MKTLIALTLTVTLALTSGCASWQPKTAFGRNAKAWWQSPATQQGIAMAEQAATQFVINSALIALQQYAGGQKLDFQEIAAKGGIATLYTQAGNIRTLQGTAQVLDPIATAQILEQGGTTEQMSRKLAGTLFESATVLIRAGLTPDRAAEVNAAALDSAAALVSSETSNE